MSDETNTKVPAQTADDVAERLLSREGGDEVSVVLADGTEVSISVVRSLHLPDSVHDGVAGGSLRYAVRTTDRTGKHGAFPSQEGLISAEQPKTEAWNRPRLALYDLVTKTDDDGNEYDDYGELRQRYEIAAIGEC